MDVSGLLYASGVELQQRALNTFGASVLNQLESSLTGMLGLTSHGVNPNARNPAEADLGATREWNTTPYAGALASGLGGFDGKTRFLFKVYFSFNPNIVELANTIGVDFQNVVNRNLTYNIKQIDHIKYNFQYDEINMYNFRTKYLRKIIHDDISFKLYDDVANNALSFLNAYTQLLSPQSRSSWSTGANLSSHGMAFSDTLAGNDSASRGMIGVNGTENGILSSIKIEQYYLDRSNPSLTQTQVRNAIKVNTFTFTNPRITSWNIDDLDYDSASTVSMASVSFNYDAIYMETGLTALNVDTPSTGLMEKNDILVDRQSGLLQPTINSGGLNGVGISPYANQFANPVQRSPLDNFLSAIPGTFISNLVGGGEQALGNQLSPTLGPLGTNAARTLTAASTGFIGSTISPMRFPIISDNTLGGII